MPETAERADSGWRIDDGDVQDIEGGTPVVTGLTLEVPVPTLQDPRADLARVLALTGGGGQLPGTDLATASQVSELARKHGWGLTAFLSGGAELVGRGRAGFLHPWGLAVDLGSTKIAAYLVNLEDGKVVASRGRLNPQVTFGADVVTRLQKAIHDPAEGRAV